MRALQRGAVAFDHRQQLGFAAQLAEDDPEGLARFAPGDGSSSMKPTVSPRRKRPLVSSRAASVTPPVRTRWEGLLHRSGVRAGVPGWRRARRRRPGRRPSSASARPGRPSRSSSAARSAAMRTLGELGSTTTSSAGTSWMPGQQLVGRRVQRRAAVQDPRAHALEQHAHPVAVDDREHAGEVDDLADALGALGDLLVHVGDVEARDDTDAVEQAGGALGLVGVDVDLERVGVADDEHGVAEALEPRDPRPRPPVRSP